MRRVQRYAENMLTKIEELAKEHRRMVLEEGEVCRDQLQAAVSARAFSEALLSFDRPEELVSMSREVFFLVFLGFFPSFYSFFINLFRFY